MKTPTSEWAAIAWAPYSRRSEMFARELGGPLHCVHFLRFQSPPHAPVKYVLQAVRTLQLLFRERPRAVHVQNPPFVCGLTVALYCWLTGSCYVVEHHSAAFGLIWDWARPFQKLVVRRAATNIVTDGHWAEVVRSWGGPRSPAHALVMHDAFLDLPEGKPFAVGPGRNVAFAGTFADDEPLDAVLAAARLVPDVGFYVTGDTAKVPPALTAQSPPNVTFTGFLDVNGEYLGLLRAVDVVMVMTTRDHTLQLAGCEAIALGTPLVTSDWPYLRDLFSTAAVYVAPTAESIRGGVVEALRRLPELRAEAAEVRRAQRARWHAQMAELRARVEAVRGGTRQPRATRAVGQPRNDRAGTEVPT
jgi:glycosyltransferase involved in cell wall biosynthesis